MTNTVTTARIDLDDLTVTDGPALRPPTDYRNLLRLRRSLLPDGKELMFMLAASLGYSVTKS